jgi:hypothetical protein
VCWLINAKARNRCMHRTHNLTLAGLAPDGPPMTDIALILTSPLNLKIAAALQVR